MRTILITSGPSASSKVLASALGIKRMSTEGKTFTSPIHLINWGCGAKGYAERYGGRMQERFDCLNAPARVTIAANKLMTFQALQEHEDIPIPRFCTDENVANAWGVPFMGRKTLTGHSGEGIIMFDPAYPHGEGGKYPAPATGEDSCPLYVEYKKKKNEYRVHVIGDHTDVQQKRKRQETPNEEVNYQVRNHQNGWVYCREDVAEPVGIRDLAIRVIEVLNLDFGAVDIIWNQKENQTWILEVNTAPGLEGQTLEFYREHLSAEVGLARAITKI